MSCHCRFVYVLLCFIFTILLVRCNTVKERRCFSTELGQCFFEETCEIQNPENKSNKGDGICKCQRDHKRNSEGKCLPVKQHPGLPTPAKVNSDSKSSSASIAAGVLVPLLFVGIAVLVLLARRYGWWQRLRQPRVRQYDTALVGGDLDDDPPIA